LFVVRSLPTQPS